MNVHHYLQTSAHALTITVIGCGGTGSVLLQHLARMNTALIAQGRKGIILTCVDDDVVTPANRGRQLFTLSDVGRPKAVVMIERINRFYGTNWMAIPDRFSVQLAGKDNFPGNIIISCVDNVKSRKEIHSYVANCSLNKYHEHIQNLYWIDTGNRKDYGQVVLSSEKPKTTNVLDMFPNMEKEEAKDNTPSCSLAEALERQDLFINSHVALITADLVWALTQQKTISWRGAFINLKKQNPVKRIKA